jgi:hypothetical protein
LESEAETEQETETEPQTEGDEVEVSAVSASTQKTPASNQRRQGSSNSSDTYTVDCDELDFCSDTASSS